MFPPLKTPENAAFWPFESQEALDRAERNAERMKEQRARAPRAYGPADFERFLARGPERRPWLYAGKGSKPGAFDLDVERTEKVTPPPNPGNVSGLAVGVGASATPKPGVEVKKPVFDALERAAGAESEWDGVEDRQEVEDEPGS